MKSVIDMIQIKTKAELEEPSKYPYVSNYVKQIAVDEKPRVTVEFLREATECQLEFCRNAGLITGINRNSTR